MKRHHWEFITAWAILLTVYGALFAAVAWATLALR